jgi:predicted transcriptional regulator
MTGRAFTLRINPEERAALQHLSKIEKRPVNQLVNEAIRLYLRRPRKAEKSWRSTLEKLREYRRRDPEFKRAMVEYVDAEASLGRDPVDGEIIEGEVLNGKIRPVGAAQSKIRELLGA